MTQPVLATLHTSAPRRILGVGILLSLGVILVYLAFTMPTGAAQIFMLGIGAVALFVAMKLRAAGMLVLELTETEFRVKDGPVLAAVANMQKIERGAFAFKPSNGFLLSRIEAGPRLWVPGLYWSMGRRIGVGGMTGAPQTKAMAEAIAGLIAARDAK